MAATPAAGAAMAYNTADLCDAHEQDLHVVESMFQRYGTLTSFDGPIATVKCYEDNSKVREALAEPGEGRILVVDGGGSQRRALLGDMLGELAVKNGWKGIVINGAIRDSDAINRLELGVRALGTIPLQDPQARRRPAQRLRQLRRRDFSARRASVRRCRRHCRGGEAAGSRRGMSSRQEQLSRRVATLDRLGHLRKDAVLARIEARARGIYRCGMAAQGTW
jgi:regulator of ribonuclease activity A